MSTLKVPRQPVVPFEVVGLTGYLIATVAVLAGGQFPASLQETLPHAAQIVWAGVSALGSALGLLGLLWRREPADALLLETIGCLVAGGASLIYGAALLVVQGTAALVPLCTIGAFGVACIWRGIGLVKFLRFAASAS